MKTILRITLVSLVFVLFLLSPMSATAQQVPPDPPGGGHGQDGDLPAGGGAPIESGIGVLIGLSIVYGSKKFYQLKQDQENQI